MASADLWSPEYNSYILLLEKYDFNFFYEHLADFRLVSRDYGVHEDGVTVCGVQHVLWVLGLRVRPGTQHFPYNENPTRALNTTSLKYCLSSTDAVDRRGKNSRMRMKIQGRLMLTRFIEIHQSFELLDSAAPPRVLSNFRISLYMHYITWLNCINELNLSAHQAQLLYPDWMSGEAWIWDSWITLHLIYTKISTMD